LWTDDESSLGDAIPKGTIRSPPRSRARGGGVRANRPIAGHTRRNRWRGSQPATSGHGTALNSFAAPSLAAVRGFFRRSRFVRESYFRFSKTALLLNPVKRECLFRKS